MNQTIPVSFYLNNGLDEKQQNVNKSAMSSQEENVAMTEQKRFKIRMQQEMAKISES